MQRPFSPNRYSQSLTDLPMDLLESELNRLYDVQDDYKVMKQGLLRAELRRRRKLMAVPDQELVAA